MKILGIPVVFDPRVTCSARSSGFWPFKRIAVGPSWYALPAEERAAVLFHEAYHCRALHLEVRVVLLPLLLVARGPIERLCRRQELAADRFAAAQGWGHHMTAMLERSRQPQTHFYPSCVERIRALRAFMEDAPCTST